MPQVNIYCVGNHFATFCWTLGFLKFLTFSWWSFHKYKISLDDGILGLIIKVMKGGISSNWSNSSSSTAFSTPMIRHFFGYNHLKSFVYCVWNIENLCDVFC
jgi:hypothetical protein